MRGRVVELVFSGSRLLLVPARASADGGQGLDSVLGQFERAGVDRVVIDGCLEPGMRWTADGAPATAEVAI